MDSDDLDTVEFLPFDQLLRRFFGEGPAPVKIAYGGASHCGKIRKSNEDHFVVMQRRRTQSVPLSNFSEGSPAAVDEDAFAFAVADGMGGEAFGNLASRLALNTGLKLGKYEINWPLKIEEGDIKEVRDKLEVYLKLMDRALIRYGSENPEAVGMGTTFTVAYTSGFHAFIGHVGDSRAYLIRNDEIKQLTRDHTVAQDLLDEGHIEMNSEEYLRQTHVLTNCLGGPKEGVFVDTHHTELEHGDRMLLCTDGLSDQLTDNVILERLQSHADPQQAADALIERAIDHGGRDNITAIVVEFQDDKPTPSATDTDISLWTEAE